MAKNKSLPPDYIKSLIEQAKELANRYSGYELINVRGHHEELDRLMSGSAIRVHSTTPVFLDLWPRTGSWVCAGQAIRGHYAKGKVGNSLLPAEAAFVEYVGRNLEERPRQPSLANFISDRPIPPPEVQEEALAETYSMMGHYSTLPPYKGP